jgi:hypothetical protein
VVKGGETGGIFPVSGRSVVVYPACIHRFTCLFQLLSPVFLVITLQIYDVFSMCDTFFSNFFSWSGNFFSRCPFTERDCSRARDYTRVMVVMLNIMESVLSIAGMFPRERFRGLFDCPRASVI